MGTIGRIFALSLAFHLTARLAGLSHAVLFFHVRFVFFFLTLSRHAWTRAPGICQSGCQNAWYCAGGEGGGGVYCLAEK